MYKISFLKPLTAPEGQVPATLTHYQYNYSMPLLNYVDKNLGHTVNCLDVIKYIVYCMYTLRSPILFSAYKALLIIKIDG